MAKETGTELKDLLQHHRGWVRVGNKDPGVLACPVRFLTYHCDGLVVGFLTSWLTCSWMRGKIWQAGSGPLMDHVPILFCAFAWFFSFFHFYSGRVPRQILEDFRVYWKNMSNCAVVKGNHSVQWFRSRRDTTSVFLVVPRSNIKYITQRTVLFNFINNGCVGWNDIQMP